MTDDQKKIVELASDVTSLRVLVDQLRERVLKLEAEAVRGAASLR